MQALVLRSRIVLACAEGLSNARVADGLGVSRETVRKWRARFVADRLEGLVDRPRSGPPRKITDEQVEALVARTLGQAPPYRRRYQEFLRFLKVIDAAVPQHLELHLVLDNYATHKTEPVKKWLLRHPRFHLHFTPTSASWLNLVERWFAELTCRKLRRSAHRSVVELERDIRGWINEWNTDPPAVRLDEDRRRHPRHPRRILHTNKRLRTLGRCATLPCPHLTLERTGRAALRPAILDRSAACRRRTGEGASSGPGDADG